MTENSLKRYQKIIKDLFEFCDRHSIGGNPSSKDLRRHCNTPMVYQDFTKVLQGNQISLGKFVAWLNEVTGPNYPALFSVRMGVFSVDDDISNEFPVRRIIILMADYLLQENK